MKRIIAVFISLSILLISAYSEEYVDCFIEMSLDLKTGETTVTEKDITSEKDFSNLLVTVTEITPDGVASNIYTGPLSGYDNGDWINVDFSDNKPFLIYDWQKKSTFWIIPSENSEKEPTVEGQIGTELLADTFLVQQEKEFSLPEIDSSFPLVEYEDEISEFIPQDAQLYINCQSNNTAENEVEMYSTDNFVFNTNLLSSFNTVTGPIIGNGANEPKFSYNEFLKENISEYSGELTLNFEDIVLEGRNGLDLRIGRTYQSVAAGLGNNVLMILPDENGYLRNRLVVDYSTYLLDRYNLGMGWGFSFPSVQIETEYVPQEVVDTFYYDEEKELYYHAGNGEVYQVQFTTDTTDSNLKGYYKKDIQFNKNDTGYNNGQITSYYSMTLSDGTKQYFAEDGRLIGIVDRYNNQIKFEHQMSRITNRVPDGEFVYDDNMWTSSETSSSKDAIHSESKGQFDSTSMKFRRNNSNGAYILSQPIQVKPFTEYEFGLSVYSSNGDDIQIEIRGYDTLYNYDHSEIFTISDYPTDEWYEFSDTFSMSTATRYIEIEISPDSAKNTYIDNVYLDEPKPLISKITDSIGRTVEFTYGGDLIEGTAGTVSVDITSPDGASTRTLTYNKSIMGFITEYQKHDEQRKHWYLVSSRTDGDDGVAVSYEYKGGTTTDSEGNTIYPQLYIDYNSKTHSTSDAWGNKPVLSAVRYKDRKKIYEYETVRKNLGDDGYYDTLRVRKTYDMYSYVPEGATKASFKGELDAVNYSYLGTYNGNTFDNETGYPNYSFDEETNLNEQWTVTKTSKSIDTVTFSNCAVVQQTSSSDGTTVTSDYTNHPVFKNSPTQIKNTTTQNDTSKETYILYSHNDWGGIATETKEIDESIKNNEDLLEKYTINYSYEPTYHQIAQKTYYHNTDKAQVSENYTYDTSGRLIESENAVGERLNYYYENETYPNILTKTVQDDPMNFDNTVGGDRVVTYTYDDYGLYATTVSETYDGGTALTSYNYDYITGDMLIKTYPDGSYEEWIYTSEGKISQYISPCSVLADGTVFYTIDVYEYYSNILLRDYNDEDVVYDAVVISRYRGQVKDEPVVNMYSIEYQYYDAVGNLKQDMVVNLGEQDSDENYINIYTEYYHDNYDRHIKTIDDEGNIVTYGYDAFNRPITVTDSENNIYTCSYNDVNSSASLILNGTNNIITQEYDLYGNIIKRTVYPDNSLESMLSESYSYDLNGNVIGYIDPKGNITQYYYDAENRLRETTLPNGVTATASYSSFNEPTFEKIFNPLGREETARATYRNEKGDVNIKLYNVDNLLVKTDVYDTDAKGRAVTVSDGENTKTVELYDEFDNPLITESGGKRIHRRYDVFGEVVSTSTDNSITQTTYGYNMLGSVTAKVQDGNHGVDYTYSDIQRMTGVTMPSGRTESFTYTPNGNLDTIVSDGKTFDYDYYDTGYVKSINYPNGLKTEYEYDNINRVTEVATTKNDSVINTFEYEYDNNSNVTKEIRNGAETTYSYDSLDRLILVTYSDGSSVSYEYDALNNRTKEIYSNGDIKDYVYNEKYQLKEVKLNGQTTDTYTYNKTGAVVTHNNETYTYNEWDKLSGYTDGENTYTYKYDANGIRTAKNDKQYIIDINNNVVAETDSTGAIADEILWGHQPLARKVNGSWYYYIYNAHGDVIGLVDDSGAIVNSYQYDPWGNILSETETVANPIKYAGEYYDDELGMYYLRARYYDPTIGRFTSLDIKEGDISNPLEMNRYVYCLNNPIKYIDPTGESWALTWGSATWWLAVADGPLPIGDAIVAGGIVVGAIIDGATIYFAKGGKQNKRSSEYRDVSDSELDRRYKDPTTSKKEKQKIKTEQKARKTRHSSQKK